MGPDRKALVEALCAANVQFVIVGEQSGQDPLRVVVSRHPTNLDALGRALGRLVARIRADSVAGGVEGRFARAGDPARAEVAKGDVVEAGGDAGGTNGTPVGVVPDRIGDPLGTLTVDTLLGGLTLLFGGPSTSLYVETFAIAEQRQIGERAVPWAPAPADVPPAPRTTGRALGRRLLSLVEGLTHLVEQRSDDDLTDPPVTA